MIPLSSAEQLSQCWVRGSSITTKGYPSGDLAVLDHIFTRRRLKEEMSAFTFNQDTMVCIQPAAWMYTSGCAASFLEYLLLQIFYWIVSVRICQNQTLYNL